MCDITLKDHFQYQSQCVDIDNITLEIKKKKKKNAQITVNFFYLSFTY